jgi:hypothetical protein
VTLLAVALALAVIAYALGVKVERRRREAQVRALRVARQDNAEYLRETTAVHYLRGRRVR